MVKRRHAVILALVTLAWSVRAQPARALEWPQTPIATIARGYIDCYNANDIDAMREFAAAHRSDEALAKRSAQARAERRASFYQQIGPLTPMVITEQSEYSITLKCKAEKSGMWMSMTLELQKEPPHKLDVVTMMPTSPPELEIETEEWEDLADLLAQVVEDSGIPAIAAAQVENGRIVDAAAAGVRAAGSNDKVELDDRWHVGSIGKSMTAIVVGAVVEAGQLEWHTTIEEVFSDIDVRNEYRPVTVGQLLRHRGGIPHYSTIDESKEQRLTSLPGTATEQRFTFIREVLQETPAGPVGDFNYSNAGYTVVACMAERASGKSWESLMEAHVFRSITLKYAGFGWPATPERLDQPRGHFTVDGDYHVQGFGEYELGAYMAPAGDVHMSIRDLAEYAVANIEGLNGKDGCVRAETMRYLHDPQQYEGNRYACGWMLVDKEAGTAHVHAGSAGTMLAHIEIYPATQRAVVVAMNVGTEGSGVAQRIVDLVNARSLETSKR